MSGFQVLAQYWGQWLNTRDGERMVEELAYFHNHDPQLRKPTTARLIRLDGALSDLTGQPNAVACLSVAKTERALSNLRTGTPELLHRALERHFTAQLEIQLGPLVLNEVSATRLFGEHYSARTAKRWENVRAGIGVSLDETRWWTFENCFQDQSEWAQFVRTRAQRTLEDSLSHLFLAIASQNDRELVEAEVETLAGKIEVAADLVDAFRAGNIPIGTTWDAAKGERTHIILVA